MKSLIAALKVVVANKIYHGSPEKFKKFETSGQGKNYGIGIYFTEDLAEAKDYADSDDTGYVYEVKLNIRNPYDPHDPKQARLIADNFNLDWEEVATNELWKNPDTGYTAEEKDNYYIKLADVLNERAKAEGRRWWEGEKELTAFIYLQWDSIHDTRKNWWVVQKPSAVKILKSTKVPATAALKSVVASHSSFLSALDPFIRDPKLVEKWDDAMLRLPLSKEMDVATDDDLFEYMVQHNIKGWDHLSEYEALGYWQDEVEDWTEEWEKYASDWLAYTYKTFQNDFKRIAKTTDGKLKIYRCMEIPSDQKKRNEFRDAIKNGTATLGKYWSWDYGSALCYWGNKTGDKEATVTALIDPSAMNAENTFYKSLHPLTGGEAEIELNEGAAVEIINVQGTGVGLNGTYMAKASTKAELTDDDLESLGRILESWVNHTLIAALKSVVANSSTYLSKFQSAYKKPSLLKDWDHYVKNPEEPEEEITDFYGGGEEWDDDLPAKEPEEIKDPKKYLTSKFKAFEKEFKAKAEFQNGKLIVHRSLTTHGDNDELIESWDEPNHEAGLYWSWTPEPQPHWGGRGRQATMIGLVGPEAIDFHKTLIKNLHPTLGDDETEIELKPGAKIEIFKLQEGRNNTLWEGSKVVKAALKSVVGSLDLKVMDFEFKKEISEEEAERSGAFGIKAYEGSKEVGYVSIYHEMSGWYVYEVSVASKSRRQGIATKLYDYGDEITGSSIMPQVLDAGVGEPEITDEAFLFWKKRAPHIVDDILEAVTDENRNKLENL